MKRTKFLSFLLAALLVLSSMSCLSVVSFAANIVASGYTPDTENAEDEAERVVAWDFYDDGTLYIYDEPGTVSWSKFAPALKKVELKPGPTATRCNVTQIPAYAFNGCYNLAEVSLSKGEKLSSIGAFAFQGCSALAEIVLDQGIISIGDYAFFGCSSLQEVGFSANLANVGANVFKGCTSLERVNIPNGVLTIGYGMFEDCTNLKTINLPDSLVSIGELAFDNCTSLEKIVVPDSTTEVGSYAFHNCSAATSVYIGHNAENIGKNAFAGCSSLEDVEIACAMSSFPEGMFMDCTSLTTINITEGVQTIGANAFKGCSALNAVKFPTTLKTIGDSAFDGTALTTVTIPAGVDVIEKGAFTNCSSLAEIIVDDKNDNFFSMDGILYNTAMGTLLLCPAGKTGDVVIPDVVDTIADDAFIGCKNLDSVTIPDSVTTIGTNAFNGCGDIVIRVSCDSSNVETFEARGIAVELIHSGAQEWVETLAPTCDTDGCQESSCVNCGVKVVTQNIPALGHDYDEGVVVKEATCTESGLVKYTCCREDCGHISYSTVSKKPHKLDAGVITKEATCTQNGTIVYTCRAIDCTYTETQVIPATHKLDAGTITTPATCTTDGVITYACTACTYTETQAVPAHHTLDAGTITTPATCTTQGVITYACTACTYEETDSFFADHAMNAGVITKQPTCTVNGVKIYSCENCDYSYKEIISASGHSLDGGKVTLEATCETNGRFTYTCENGCGYTKSTVIPAVGHSFDAGVVTKTPTIKENGEMTYTCTAADCGYTYTEAIPSLGLAGYKAFNADAYIDENGDIQNLKWYITIADELHVIADMVNPNEWAAHTATIKTATYEKEATTVYNGTFAYMPKLESVHLLFTSGTIEAYAFQYCDNLKTVQIGTAAIIGDYAFYNCDALETVTIYGGLAEVGKNVFKNCDSLKTVVIGNGSLNIGYGMFEDCSALETVDLPDSLVSIGELAFDNCVSLKAIAVPDSVTSVGRYAFHNCSTATSVYIGHNAEDIGEYAFSGCSSLEDVEIACAMRIFPTGMFMGCTSITSIELEEGVESIGKNAFKDCSALAEINIPSTVRTIGDSAFDGTALKEINIPADVELIDRGAFTNCNSLEAINVDDKNDFYFSVDGVIYDIRLNTLMLCPAGKKGEVAVWHTTTAIADDAFIGCKGITKVTIPNSVMQIGANAFNNCATNIIIKGNCDSQGIAYAKARGMATEITHVAGQIWQTKVEPNCLDKGLDELVCSGCGDVAETKETDALGHNYDSGVVTTDATCDTDGVMTYTCQREGCKESYTKPIPALKHNFDAGKVISPATCDSKGTMRYSCQNAGCLEYYDEDIKALGHSLDAGTVTKAVTCTEDGEKIYKCTNTGCLYEEKEILTKLGHNYVAVEIKKATCIENGKVQYTCSNCGDAYVEITTGTHPQTATATVNPTCTKAGKTGQWCAVCNSFVGTVTEIPATGHKYENGACTACGDKKAQNPSNPGGTVVTPESGSNNEGNTNTPVASKPATPKLLLLKNRNEGLVLTWRAVEGAKAYRVYRRGAGEKSWTYLTTVTGTTFVDSKAETGKYWRYTVRATNDAGYSGFENGLYIKRVNTPHLTGISNVASGVKISWSSISNAKSYKIYRRGVGESWKCIATVGASVTSYTDTSIKNNSGNYYRYTVRAIDGYYSYFEDGLLTRFVATPHLKGIAKTSNGVKVNWSAVKGADSYRVYRRGAGQSWVYVTTVTGTSYVDTAVKDATGYYRYTVRAVDSGRYSGYEAGLLIKK